MIIVSEKKNSVSELPSSENEKVSEDEAVEFAKKILADVYNLDITYADEEIEFETTQNSKGEKLSSYFVYLKIENGNLMPLLR